MNKNFLMLGGIVLILVLGTGAYLVQTDNKPADTTVVTPMTVTSGENPRPGDSVHNLPVEPAAAVARKDLATKLGVTEGSIVIMQITDTTWNDGCLGLGGPTESCLQAIVPGFEVEMLANGKTYFYRTDKTGVTVRAEN